MTALRDQAREEPDRPARRPAHARAHDHHGRVRLRPPRARARPSGRADAHGPAHLRRDPGAGSAAERAARTAPPRSCRSCSERSRRGRGWSGLPSYRSARTGRRQPARGRARHRPPATTMSPLVLKTPRSPSRSRGIGGERGQEVRYVQPFPWPDGRVAAVEVRQTLAGVERDVRAGAARRHRLQSHRAAVLRADHRVPDTLEYRAAHPRPDPGGARRGRRRPHPADRGASHERDRRAGPGSSNRMAEHLELAQRAARGAVGGSGCSSSARSSRPRSWWPSACWPPRSRTRSEHRSTSIAGTGGGARSGRSSRPTTRSAASWMTITAARPTASPGIVRGRCSTTSRPPAPGRCGRRRSAAAAGTRS